MITIFGATGFIGSNIVKYLESENIEYYLPKRNEKLDFSENLGDVIYSIGLTSDFRNKPFETVEAHVGYLSEILEKAKFNSFIYLSSTRVYKGLDSDVLGHEDMKLSVESKNIDEIYNISKIMGESLCYAQKNKNIKIARLSNVFGYDEKSKNFLNSIIKEVIKSRELELYTTLSSAKDYIYIDDAVKLIVEILLYGKEKIYNIASGINYSNEFIINEMKKNVDFNYKINEKAEQVIFPKISTKKIQSEFNFKPTRFEDKLIELINLYKEEVFYEKL